MDVIDIIKNTKRIAIFGAQAIACGVIAALIESFRKVPEIVIVSEYKDNPTEIYGIKVIELKNAFEYKECTVLIAMPIVFHAEIAQALCLNGFNDCIAIDSVAEFDIMSRYYKELGRFKLLGDYLPSNHNSNTAIYRARSIYDKELKVPPVVYDSNIFDIHAGAALCDIRLSSIADDMGDNISEQNKNFCELTATYWVWKNVRTDYKGICHYRRILQLSSKDYYRLDEIDVVLPLPFVRYPNASGQFLRFISDADYKVLLDILKQNSTDYYLAAHKHWYERYLYNYNMLIARQAIFDSYCEFLFEILFAVEKYFNDRGIVRQDRYLGYMGEILTSLYFMHNAHRLRVAHAPKLWFD